MGNFHSLNKQDVAEKTFDFYQQFYAKNKLKIVTVCNKDKTKRIKKIIAREADSLSDKRPAQKSLSAPRIYHNRLILIKAETTDKLIITKYLDVSESDYAYLSFITTVYDNVLTQVLIEEEKVVDSLTTTRGVNDGIAEVEIRMELSFKGKEKLRPVLDSTFATLNSLHLLFNKNTFEEVKADDTIAFKLRDKPGDAFQLSHSLLDNFIDFGFEGIERGFSLVEAEYHRIRIINLWRRLKSGKSLLFFVGKLESTRSKGGKMKPGFNLDESVREANLGSKYSESALLDTRLTDFSYLGENKKKNGDAEFRGKIVLDFYHPEYKLDVGYLKISTTDLRRSSIKYSPNPFKVSNETLGSVSKTPTGLVKDLSESNSFYSRLNTKYALFSLSVFIDLFPDENKLSGRFNTEFQALKILLDKRFARINDFLENLKSRISTIVRGGVLTLRIDTTPDNVKAISDIIIKQFFDHPVGIAFPDDEKNYALNRLYSSLTDKIPILIHSKNVLKRYINSKTVQSRKEAIKQIKKIDKPGLRMPRFRVGRVYTEGYINDKLNDYIVNDLVRKVDPKFDPKKDFDFGKYQRELQGFSKRKQKTVVLGLRSLAEEDRNEVYIHLFRTKRRRSDLQYYSAALVLREIVHQTAMEYLRTKQQIGFVVEVDLLEENGELLFRLLVQTTDIERARQLVELFYILMEKGLGSLTKKKLLGYTRRVRDRIGRHFGTVFEEAGVNHWNIMEEIKPGYGERISSYLRKGSVKKELLLSVFLDVFRCGTSKKIIVDSTVGENDTRYSVGPAPFIISEKYEVRFYSD